MRLRLNNTSACGFDEIPIRFIKLAIDYIAYLLSVIINSSFAIGLFLTFLKNLKIVPFFKKSDRRKIDNLKPVLKLDW